MGIRSTWGGGGNTEHLGRGWEYGAPGAGVGIRSTGGRGENMEHLGQGEHLGHGGNMEHLGNTVVIVVMFMEGGQDQVRGRMEEMLTVWERQALSK